MLIYLFFFIDDGIRPSPSSTLDLSFFNILNPSHKKTTEEEAEVRKRREPTIEKTWPSTFEHIACTHAHTTNISHTWIPCPGGTTRRLLHSSLHPISLISHLLSSLTHHSPFLPSKTPKMISSRSSIKSFKHSIPSPPQEPLPDIPVDQTVKAPLVAKAPADQTVKAPADQTANPQPAFTPEEIERLSRPKVLISGAGIGGLTLAILLQKGGIPYEGKRQQQPHLLDRMDLAFRDSVLTHTLTPLTSIPWS